MTINARDITMELGAGGKLVPQNPVSPAVGLIDPSLATNATGIADWSPAYPFIDLMKQSRAWTAPGYGNWDTLSAGGYIHTDGYVNAIPPAASAVEAVFDWGESQGTYYGGERFVVTWEGTGTVSLGGAVSVVSSTANSITFDFNANPSTLTVRILTTGAVPNHIKNITIIADKFQSLYDSGERLNPDYVDFVQDFRVFRFMDWMQTNWSKIVDWADYTTESAPTYANEGNDTGLGNRAPMSMIVAMANKIQADPWVCIPHQASDAFVTTFAEYMRDNLDSNLVCHFELSNEIWNFNFPHWEYFRDIGLADWPGAAGEDGMTVALNAYAKRAVQCFALIDAAYAGQLGRRKNVLGSSNDDVTDQSVAATTAPLWQTYDPTGYIRPSTVAQALAIAPYYGTAMWGTDSAGLAAAYVNGTHIQWMYNWLTDPVNESSMPSMISNMALQKGVSDAEGLELIQYEGLRHYLHSGTATGDTLTAMLEFSESIYDADLVSQAWEAWELIGDGPLMVFADLTTPGESGVWGMVAHYGHTSPYAETLAGFNYYTPNFWGGTGDYRNNAVTGATSYYPDVGTGKPASGTALVSSAKYHVFGHSLFTYTGGDAAPDTAYTKVGEWLGLLAGHASLSSVGSFTFGFYSGHNAQDFSGDGSGVTITGSYDIGNTTPFTGNFSGQNYSLFLSMPSNFLAVDMGEPPYTNSTLTTQGEWEDLDDNIDLVYPSAEHVLYIHWPDAGPYAVSSTNARADFTTYNNATMAEYLNWHITLQDNLVTAGRTIRAFPVGPIIAWLFENVNELNALNFNDVYGDSAPHGSENIYFLAALVCFRSIYGHFPNLAGFTFPGAATQMRSEITNNLPVIDAAVKTRLDYHNANGVIVY